MAERTVISETCLGMGDGGFTFAIVDDGHGPCLETRSSHFGNCENTLRVLTTLDGLKSMRDVLDKAIAHQGYSKEYCYAAKPSRKE
jgi:hypothetical protein